ncbi:hypothetical protein Lal_00000997 [Lupinus albus]|nr:hypothetical protein Lal_00000997 [Lupinus albus]
MARRVNFIEEINATKDTWKIKVRIVGLWRVDRSSAPSLEMIFMDENGDKIEAVVKNYHISLWETKIQEGQSYVGENFDVKGTIMTNKQLSEIPLYIYQFTAFEDILSGVATTNVLIDFIGEFIDIEMSQPESMPKKVVFGMRDQRGNNISCTLWGQFASQLLKYERDHKFGPIVVILTLAKIREAKGGYPITIQNTMYGSKLFINDNIQEIQVFTKSLGSGKPHESYNQRMSNTSSSSVGGSQDKFFQNAVVKTISELIQLDHESVCVTYGTIEKKADAIRIPFNCPGCGKFLKEVVPRYRVEIRANYNHDNMKFVLWNRECE